MDILSYVKGVPTFKKRELLDKIATLTVIATDLTANITRLEANKIDLGHEINKWAITKSIVRDLDNAGYRGVGFNHAIKNCLTTIVAVADGLGKMVQKDRNETWDGKLMNLRQANLLNLLEHSEHWLKFTSMVYDVLMTLKNGGATDPERYLAKTDIRFINGTVDFYKGTTLQLLQGSRTVIAKLEAIPEVDVTETSIAVLEGTEDKSLTQILKQGFGVHNLNPVFWYKLSKMNLNLARIEKARRDNETFAMKISQAVNKKNGVEDADLDNQIEIYQDQIIKNVALIESIEADYA